MSERQDVSQGFDDIRHRADCALNTTHHLTCTCDYHTRWREHEVLLHDPQCSWVRMHPNGWSNMGNCDCGAPDAEVVDA